MRTLEQITRTRTSNLNKNKVNNSNVVLSGYERFDRIIHGFQKGQLSILAGRAGMGTTTLSINITRNIIQTSNNKVGVFILDKTSQQWADLFLKSGSNTSDSMDSVFVDDTQYISILELLDKIVALKNNHDIDLVIVDYLQLITGLGQPKKKFWKGNYESIVHLLRTMAEALNVAVLLISTLPRKVEKKANQYRPYLYHLSEYGNIDKNAELVMFLYRYDYYGILEDEEGEDLSNKSVLIIAKNRNGAITEIGFEHNFNKALFKELS